MTEKKPKFRLKMSSVIPTEELKIPGERGDLTLQIKVDPRASFAERSFRYLGTVLFEDEVVYQQPGNCRNDLIWDLSWQGLKFLRRYTSALHEMDSELDRFFTHLKTTRESDG